MKKFIADEQTLLHKNKNIKSFNFKRPNKFTKEILEVILIVFRNYTRAIQTVLTVQLRTSVNVEINRIYQTSFYEYSQEIVPYTIYTTFRMEPFDGTFLLNFDADFSFVAIDALTGGLVYNEQREREYTQIEKQILKRLGGYFIENLGPAWRDVLEIKPTLGLIDTNALVAQSISQDDSVAILELVVTFGLTNSIIKFCFPYQSLNNYLDKFQISQHHSKVVEGRDEFFDEISSSIMDSVVNLEVEVGKTEINFRDLIDLEEKDIIILNQKANKPISVKIEGVEQFYAAPGTNKNKFVAKIVSLKEKSDH